MYDWIEELIRGFSDAISGAFSQMWENISGSIFDIFIKWLYDTVFRFIASFFTLIGNMGTELFDLYWVRAFVKLFSSFGWALFAAGLVVALFDTAIEYQSMEKISIKRQIMPVIYGFLSVSLFTVVPVRLYKWCISVQGTLMKELAGLFAAGYGAGKDLGEAAGEALSSLGRAALPGSGSGITNLFFVIALGYCVIKIFFSNIKRSGILLTQIAVGSMYMFSVPKGDFDGFVSWCRQVIALCLTAFLQMTLLYLGLLTWQSNMLLGLGVILAANEVPGIARQFGLDTSIKVHFSSAVHNTTMAVNAIRAVAKK